VTTDPVGALRRESAVGIDPVADSPQVGHNLTDHPLRSWTGTWHPVSSVWPTLAIRSGCCAADSPHWQADEQPAGGRRAYPRANTNAPAIMIGERCADFILRACG